MSDVNNSSTRLLFLFFSRNVRVHLIILVGSAKLENLPCVPHDGQLLGGCSMTLLHPRFIFKEFVNVLDIMVQFHFYPLEQVL